MSQYMTRRYQREEAHRRYRASLRAFRTRRQIRQLRLHDGGSPQTKPGWRDFPPEDATGRPYSLAERRAMRHGVYKWSEQEKKGASR